MEPGTYYHIYNRGNNRENIFRAEENYRYFLQQYRQYVHAHVETYAYCLMPNHFHFTVRTKPDSQAVETTTAELSVWSKAFKNFFISYAKSFNHRYQRTGSLFQYKFKRKEVNQEDYLIRLICYIHANPIAAGLCDSFEQWKYSSYNALVGSQPTALSRDSVIEWFGGRENFIEIHRQNLVRLKELDFEEPDFKNLEDF